MKYKIKSCFTYPEKWNDVTKNIRRIVSEAKNEREDIRWLNAGQCKSLEAIAKRLKQNGLIIADEVGMGKTRIAVALAKAVVEAGGRVAVLIPTGLGYQWQEEFRAAKIEVPSPVRSLNGFFDQCPNDGWFSEHVLLVSHLFSNWQHKQNSRSWRVALLPEMYACLRKEKLRTPKNYKKWSLDFSNPGIDELAKHIVSAIPKDASNPARKRLRELSGIIWTKNLFEPESYTDSGGKALRNQLKTCVGLGLGIFDLVIIDEAHKNRGEKTGLSKLLDNIICRSPEHRVIGLTATPVELELDDWLSSLKRIGVDVDAGNIKESIQKYADAVDKVRVSWQVSEQDRNKFKSSSVVFKKTLDNYIIRRNKREDKSVQLFKEKTGLDDYQYRTEKEILIDPLQPEFPETWKKIVCAAEALSFCSSLKEDPISKRIRLTLASGHGINELLDNFTAGADIDIESEQSVQINDNDFQYNNKIHDQKRQDRSTYWTQTIFDSLAKLRRNLFHHPPILTAIKCIEEDYTSSNHKVLVFGKFTKPMQDMVALLNAREMIRRLDSGRFWPQIQISRAEEPGVNAALTQLRGTLQRKWTIGKIRDVLKKNENKREYSRKKFRKDFLQNLENGYHGIKMDTSNFSYQLLKKLKAELLSGRKKERDIFNQLTRACHELYFGAEHIKEDKIDKSLLWEKYQELVLAIMDEDKDRSNSNEEQDSSNLGILDQLNERLKEEFGSQTPTFARFMFGQTLQHSRRLMQSAFNREHSFPYVLVAQSKVGREGLNLHKACKTVIMLHPEWNPSVAEQQVGRVDRLGSLWSQMIDNYDGQSDNIPKIEIRPVIFKHTYDEEHWRVLKERWDDLRAQLHGVIIPGRMAENASNEEKEIIADLNAHAPDFTP